MSQRINPIGPNGLRPMPVPRVERRKRTPEDHQPGDEQDQFDEELERELRKRESTAAAAQVDLSSGSQQGQALVREDIPAKPDSRDDGQPHIDVSV